MRPCPPFPHREDADPARLPVQREGEPVSAAAPESQIEESKAVQIAVSLGGAALASGARPRPRPVRPASDRGRSHPANSRRPPNYCTGRLSRSIPEMMFATDNDLRSEM